MPSTKTLASVLPIHPSVFFLLMLTAITVRVIFVLGLRRSEAAAVFGDPSIFTLSDMLAFRVWRKSELPPAWRLIGKIYGLFFLAGVTSFLLIVSAILVAGL